MSDAHVVFTAHGHRIALPVARVSKVRPLARVTRIPGTTRDIVGAMNDEGNVVTVIDLAARLGMAPNTADTPWVVLLDHEDGPVGLLVATVEDVVALRPSADPPEAPSLLMPWVQGALEPVPVAPQEAPGSGEGLDDAEWLRYTLGESARIMGFQATSVRSQATDTLPADDKTVWLLDARRVLEGSR